MNLRLFHQKKMEEWKDPGLSRCCNTKSLPMSNTTMEIKQGFYNKRKSVLPAQFPALLVDGDYDPLFWLLFPSSC
jgi:hypothetical protein